MQQFSLGHSQGLSLCFPCFLPICTTAVQNASLPGSAPSPPEIPPSSQRWGWLQLRQGTVEAQPRGKETGKGKRQKAILWALFSRRCSRTRLRGSSQHAEHDPAQRGPLAEDHPCHGASTTRPSETPGEASAQRSMAACDLYRRFNNISFQQPHSDNVCRSLSK